MRRDRCSGACDRGGMDKLYMSAREWAHECRGQVTGDKIGQEQAKNAHGQLLKQFTSRAGAKLGRGRCPVTAQKHNKTKDAKNCTGMGTGRVKCV